MVDRKIPLILLFALSAWAVSTPAGARRSLKRRTLVPRLSPNENPCANEEVWEGTFCDGENPRAYGAVCKTEDDTVVDHGVCPEDTVCMEYESEDFTWAECVPEDVSQSQHGSLETGESEVEAYGFGTIEKIVSVKIPATMKGASVSARLLCMSFLLSR